MSVIRYKRQCKVVVNNVNANGVRDDRTNSAGPKGISEATVER